MDFEFCFAYHNTKIEGNPLSLEEAKIAFYDEILNPSKEILEIKNHKNIMSFLISHAKNQTKINANFIKEIHKILMNGILDNNGEFKKIQNVILGADFETTKPYLVPTSIYKLCDDLYFRLNNAKNSTQKLKIILKSHIDYERIHPFSDGNGRVGRVIMLYLCLKLNLKPFIISQKDDYIKALRECDVDALYKLIK